MLLEIWMLSISAMILGRTQAQLPKIDNSIVANQTANETCSVQPFSKAKSTIFVVDSSDCQNYFFCFQTTQPAVQQVFRRYRCPQGYTYSKTQTAPFCIASNTCNPGRPSRRGRAVKRKTRSLLKTEGPRYSSQDQSLGNMTKEAMSEWSHSNKTSSSQAQAIIEDVAKALDKPSIKNISSASSTNAALEDAVAGHKMPGDPSDTLPAQTDARSTSTLSPSRAQASGTVHPENKVQNQQTLLSNPIGNLTKNNNHQNRSSDMRSLDTTETSEARTGLPTLNATHSSNAPSDDETKAESQMKTNTRFSDKTTDVPSPQNVQPETANPTDTNNNAGESNVKPKIMPSVKDTRTSIPQDIQTKDPSDTKPLNTGEHQEQHEHQSIRGPKGPRGPPGRVGPMGLRGPPGAEGPQGNDGSQGPRGPPGRQGPYGPPGPLGSRGVQGPPGPHGAKGPHGLPGPKGPRGPLGPTGPQGEMGDQGGLGQAGVRGPPGDSGDPGSIIAGIVGHHKGVDIYEFCHQNFLKFRKSDKEYYYRHPTLGCEEYVICYLGYGKVASCPAGWQMDTMTDKCTLVCQAKGLKNYVVGALGLVAIFTLILGLLVYRIRRRLIYADTEKTNLIVSSVSFS